MSGGPFLYALICLMVVGWSGNYIVGKIALRELPPLLLGGLRISLAAAFMLPVFWWQQRKARDPWTSDEWPLLLGLGVLGVVCNQLLFILGLGRTSAAHAAIFANLTPIVVMLLAAMRGQEKITGMKVLGMFVALGGVAVLKAFEAPARSGVGPTWAGDLLIFGGACAFALFTVVGKPVTKRHSSVTVNTVAYVSGAVLMAPITLWQSSGFPFAKVSFAAWAALVYMALLGSVICYLIYYYALTRMAASRVSAFSYFQPPVATVLGIVVLGERITLSLVAALMIIFSGVYLTERR